MKPDQHRVLVFSEREVHLRRRIERLRPKVIELGK